MASVTSDLKLLRQQVESLQAEVAGRKAIGAMIVWDQQNESSVNQNNYPNLGTFNGLIVHLTPELSPQGGTGGLGQNEFNDLKQQIRDSLDAQTRPTDA
jgi:hypothetical protein